MHRRRKGLNRRILLKLVGVQVSITSAYIMFDGALFGENTSGYATVLGIIGIGLIASSNNVGSVFEKNDRMTG